MRPRLQRSLFVAAADLERSTKFAHPFLRGRVEYTGAVVDRHQKQDVNHQREYTSNDIEQKTEHDDRQPDGYFEPTTKISTEITAVCLFLEVKLMQFASLDFCRFI